MAGIGFEIRKLLEKDSYFSKFKALGFAGLITTGPWVFSILGVVLIGVFGRTLDIASVHVTQFSVTVTYLIAGSLILTGIIQLLFTRYIADQVYSKNYASILPSLLGALFVTTTVSTCVSGTIVYFFDEMTVLYRLLMVVSFVVLCNKWIVMSLLSGLKQYERIVWSFFIGYALTVGLALLLKTFLIEGLMLGFFIGQSVLLLTLLILISQFYPNSWSVDFTFLKRMKPHFYLIVIGVAYNLGIWFDKIIFWFSPATSMEIIAPLRASVIYDLPVFFSYVTIIPGMAMFLITMETYFVESCSKYFRSMEESSFSQIEQAKSAMVKDVTIGLSAIFKVQLITAIISCVLAPSIFSILGISAQYLTLFYVLTFSVVILILFQAVLNVCFYLDLRPIALTLCLIFALSNGLLSYWSIKLGPEYFGYGFLIALFLSTVYGLFAIYRSFSTLEHYVFMKHGTL